MTAIVSEQGLERLKFFNGQRLFADDLQAIEGFQRTMRQLHNRSLHQAGIGSGFAVSGQRGDREVVIGPGYAIDSEGREIVHTRTRREPIPPVQGNDDGSPAEFYLTVSYPSDLELEAVETRAGICVKPGAVRLSEEPIFCWVRADGPVDPKIAAAMARGERILLAQITVLDCKLESLTLTQRRNARPATQSNIVCGREGQPDWKLLDLHEIFGNASPPALRHIVILKASVTTVDAKLVGNPTYLARIDGPREFEIPGKRGQAPIKCLAECAVSVESPMRDKFNILALTIVVSSAPLGSVTKELFRDWSIVWMGIE